MDMGKLVYGHDYEIEFDDRELAHLQIAIGLKLRRKEGFFFSWSEDISRGSGRTAIWIDPGIPLIFKYSGSRLPLINRDWLDALTRSSSSARGLQLISESDPQVTATLPSETG
jgi:hypothetical protein